MLNLFVIFLRCSRSCFPDLCDYRLNRLVEEADYQHTTELFGGKSTGGRSLEDFIPKSEQDFLEYAELLSQKIRPFEVRQSQAYFFFLASLCILCWFGCRALMSEVHRWLVIAIKRDYRTSLIVNRTGHKIMCKMATKHHVHLSFAEKFPLHDFPQDVNATFSCKHERRFC